jgi:hypothetical protein
LSQKFLFVFKASQTLLAAPRDIDATWLKAILFLGFSNETELGFGGLGRFSSAQLREAALMRLRIFRIRRVQAKQKPSNPI